MSGPELQGEPRRLTLLYQLYLTSQASRALMKHALAGSGMTGEEYALYSYLFANGSRTLSQGARDLGMPITTIATLLQQPVRRGEIVRRPHPADGRARLLSLTDAGTARLTAAMPAFTRGYRVVLAQLEAMGADVEAIFAALAELRRAVDAAAAGLAGSVQAANDAG
jgi:DNA-binding MarR family transcriptional regulator